MAAAPAWPGRPPVDTSAHHFYALERPFLTFSTKWKKNFVEETHSLAFVAIWVWNPMNLSVIMSWEVMEILVDHRHPPARRRRTIFPLIYFPFQAWTSSKTRKTQKELCWKQIQLPFDHNMKLISCYGKSRSNRVGNRRPGRSHWSWQVASYEWVQSQDKYTTNPRKIKQELCWKNNPLEGHEFIGSIQTSASMGSARFS